MFFSDVHDENAADSISVTLAGSVIVSIVPQPLNAELPIFVTEEGILMLLSFLHSENRFDFISLSDDESLTLSSVVQPVKTLLPR